MSTCHDFLSPKTKGAAAMTAAPLCATQSFNVPSIKI
jgi:hypothetical protein